MWDFSNRGQEWRWHNTVSFWIASSFIMGSLLFIIVATASMLSPHFTNGWVDVHGGGESLYRNPWRGPTSEDEWEWEWKAKILIEYAYLVGGSYYTPGRVPRLVPSAQWVSAD